MVALRPPVVEEGLISVGEKILCYWSMTFVETSW